MTSDCKETWLCVFTEQIETAALIRANARRAGECPPPAPPNSKVAQLRDKKKKILSRTIAAMVDAEVMKQNIGGSFYVKYKAS